MSALIRASLGRVAPFFKATAWDCPSKSFKEISLDHYKDRWLLLFFYPLNFTFVCPTEIVEFSRKAEEFRKLECDVVGCSIDSHFSHREYTLKSRADGGLGDIDIPLLADLKKEISDKYNVLNEGGLAYRGTFLIDKRQIIRHLSVNDLGVGRNVDQYYRLLEAFQHNEKHGEVCPASWKKGGPAITPDVKGAETYWKNTHKNK